MSNYPPGAANDPNAPYNQSEDELDDYCCDGCGYEFNEKDNPSIDFGCYLYCERCMYEQSASDDEGEE